MMVLGKGGEGKAKCQMGFAISTCIAFQRFKKLEDFCFGSELDPYHQVRIVEFTDAYLVLNLPITSKVISCTPANGLWCS